ncbi:MAG: hypothetical protein JXP37_10780 [Coriobacteriia bacterium]|nr:hypothetical protein [Coriobacteriia bacterium]
MPVVTDEDGTDDNEGPHCRNCHTGASDCFTCHSNDDRYVYNDATRIDVSSAYNATTTVSLGNRSNYAPVTSYRASAVVGGVGDPCLDGGFSFPHRTLGKDMLKDELWGIDFDGSPIAFGEVRTANANTLAAYDGVAFQATDPLQAYVTGGEYYYIETRNGTSIVPTVVSDDGALVGQLTENMDSVCIDCHGDASYWNGDNTAFLKPEGESALPLGTYGSGEFGGWEMILKGLP